MKLSYYGHIGFTPEILAIKLQAISWKYWRIIGKRFHSLFRQYLTPNQKYSQWSQYQPYNVLLIWYILGNIFVMSTKSQFLGSYKIFYFVNTILLF